MKVEQTMKALAVVAVVLACWASTVEPQVPQIPTVTFNVKGATKVTYDKFIGDLRKAVTVRGSKSNGFPVLPSTSVFGAKDRTRYVEVKLMGYKYNVELAIDVTDVYVLGYRPGDEKRSYFFQDVTKDVQNLLFQGTTTRTGLSFTGNYISLERKAKTHRDQIPLGFDQLRKKVEDLNKITLGGNNDIDIAKALLVCLQMVSEAARFTVIQEKFAKLTPYESLLPNLEMKGYQKNWNQLSIATQTAKKRRL